MSSWMERKLKSGLFLQRACRNLAAERNDPEKCQLYGGVSVMEIHREGGLRESWPGSCSLLRASLLLMAVCFSD